jgi:pimeloyl-ACP methyl ester carboxylesterase
MMPQIPERSCTYSTVIGHAPPGLWSSSDPHGVSEAPATAQIAAQDSSNPPSIEKGPIYNIQQLYKPPDGVSTVIDVVFVHGLTGNAYNTWLHKKTNIHWPSTLLKESIQDARILSFGYDADIFNWWSQASENRVGDHAENLLGALTRLRESTESEDRKIIFVAHSLGGLVAEKAISLSRHSPFEHLRGMEKNTVGMIFLGTPHFGADTAKWATYCGNVVSVVKQTNVPIVALLKSDSEMLASIQKEFQGILRQRIDDHTPIEISCFYEELPVKVIGKVNLSALHSDVR